MDDGQILLAKLSQGAIGESNSYLLGTLLVSRFYQTALSRQGRDETDRRAFYLYIDEFHNFITPSLSTILSGARKYQLGIILAHQDMSQLSNRDSQLAASLTTNPCTRIAFRLGEQDARRLSGSFSSFESSDLQSLGRGEAICRVGRSDHDFNLETLPISSEEGASTSGSASKQEVIGWSRRRYSTPRSDVESQAHRLSNERSPTEASFMLCIPTYSATDSGANRPPNPILIGRVGA